MYLLLKSRIATLLMKWKLIDISGVNELRVMPLKLIVVDSINYRCIQLSLK